MATVSIIITTHQRPDRLPAAIVSAQSASQDVEVIVVDDASTDETADLCASIKGIRYVRVERNQGVAGARNIGLVASRGEFISFLDDDDLRLPNSLDEQIEALSHAPEAMLCYAQAIPEDAGGKRQTPFPEHCLQGDIFWELLAQNFIPCTSVVFRRSCIGRVGLLDHHRNRIDDWDLWLRIAEIFPVVGLSKPVVIWRQPTPTSAQGSSNTVELIALATTHFRHNCLRMPRVAQASRRERQQAWRAFSINFAEHLAWEAFRGLCDHKLGRAFASTRTLLRLHPDAVLRVPRRWMRFSTINALTRGLRRGDLENAKSKFKHMART